MKQRFIHFGNKQDHELYLLREDTILSFIVHQEDENRFAIEVETPTCTYQIFVGTLEETTARYIKLCKDLRISSTKVYL